MSLRAAYLSMHRQADATFSQFGVTANQFVVLSVLAEHDDLTQRMLVDRIASDANTIRPILTNLENRRFISRSPHSTDKRAKCVKLTNKGRKAFERMWAESDGFRDGLVGAFSKSETRALIALLDRVTVTMQNRESDKSDG